MTISAVSRYAALPAVFTAPKTGASKSAQNQNADRDLTPVEPVKPVARESAGVRLRDSEAEQRKQDAGRQARLGREALSPLRDPDLRLDDQPSTAFLVQLIAQDAQPQPGVGLAGYGQTIDEHRDAAAIGSLVYRQAGAEPEVLSGRATFLSIAV